jgi:NAD(P)-dependent dehydrogenase (short-subunit alcohol dehydrogenase family)
MALLNGRVALITGGADGIGKGIAARFAREDAAVGLLDVSAAAAEQTAGDIQRAGGRALALPADVSNSADVDRAVNRLVETFGPPGILVHNAAVMPEGAIDRTSEEDWERAFAVNVRGAYLACRKIVPLMRSSGGGSIVLVASITGMNGFPALAAYSATKGALISLARAMAIDHAAENIRVNATSPGTVDSPMLHRFVAAQSDPQRTRRAFDDIQPRGRVGAIAEIAGVVAFLASDEASFISGANINVDGAMSVKSEQPRF